MVGSLPLFAPEILQGPTGEEGLIPLRLSAFSCVSCALSKTRKNVVFGAGCAETPKVMFVGESPGSIEDESGIPFSGRAGQLLDRMIESVGLSKSEVFLTNCILCHPPDSHTPSAEELISCSTYLLGQIRTVRPQVLVALGNTAAQTLLRSKKQAADLRGKWHEMPSLPPVRVTWHPAFLLRNPKDGKKEAFLDLQVVMQRVRSVSA